MDSFLILSCLLVCQLFHFYYIEFILLAFYLSTFSYIQHCRSYSCVIKSFFKSDWYLFVTKWYSKLSIFCIPLKSRGLHLPLFCCSIWWTLDTKTCDLWWSLLSKFNLYARVVVSRAKLSFHILCLLLKQKPWAFKSHLSISIFIDKGSNLTFSAVLKL